MTKRMVHEKFKVIQLAEELGNISESCRIMGVSRTQFYKYKKRYAEDGLEGLISLPPIHKTHPQTTKPDIAEKVISISLENPVIGCKKIKELLLYQGVNISPPTIQKILYRAKLGTIKERAEYLDYCTRDNSKPLNQEQEKLIVNHNPRFKEKDRCITKPGQLMIQDSFLLGSFREIGKVYVDFVIDVHSSLCFASLSYEKYTNPSIRTLQDYVLPFFYTRSLDIKCIETCSRRSTKINPFSDYDLFMLVHGIEHRQKSTIEGPDGFAQYVHKFLSKDFFNKISLESVELNMLNLQLFLEDYIDEYNNTVNYGFPNYGYSPMNMIKKTE